MSDDYANMMTIDAVAAENCIVMYLIGECDMSTVPMLTKELHGAIQDRKHVILDVHLLTYRDSTGLSAIASANKSLAQSKRQMRVVGAHGIFSRVIRLCKLDSMIPLDENMDDAITSLPRD